MSNVDFIVYRIQRSCSSARDFLAGCASGSGIVSVASLALAGVAEVFHGCAYLQGAWYGLLTAGKYTTFDAVVMAPAYSTAAIGLFKLALISACLFIAFKVTEKVVGLFAN